MTPEECGKTSLSGWTGLVFRQRVMLAQMERVLAHFAGAHGLGSHDVVFLTSFMYRLSRSRRDQGLPSTAPPMSSIFPPSPLPLAARVWMAVTTATES